MPLHLLLSHRKRETKHRDRTWLRSLHLSFALLAIVSMGCMKKYESAPYDQYAYPANQYDYQAYEQGYGGYGSYGGGMLSNAMAEASMEYDKNAPAKTLSKRSTYEKTKEEQGPVAQMIHYNGYAMLQVIREDETLSKIHALAKSVGGDIERQSAHSITIRVPKAHFASTFQNILEFGEVVSKSITSEDVSEEFTSVELRLQTSKTTRDRLLVLLEKSKDEKEKIEILREIQRLNEQIDVIESQMRTLQNLAEYSSISIELQPRSTMQNGNTLEPMGFSWIHNLSPFDNRTCHSGKRLELQTPTGFVSLQKKGAFIAESADGTVLRSTRLANQPNGDATFWQTAIHQRIAGGFVQVEQGTLGKFQTITLHEDSDTPYIWTIAISTVEDELWLIEAYYPNVTQWDRYHGAIESSITGGAQ